MNRIDKEALFEMQAKTILGPINDIFLRGKFALPPKDPVGKSDILFGKLKDYEKAIWTGIGLLGRGLAKKETGDTFMSFLRKRMMHTWALLLKANINYCNSGSLFKYRYILIRNDWRIVGANEHDGLGMTINVEDVEDIDFAYHRKYKIHEYESLFSAQVKTIFRSINEIFLDSNFVPSPKEAVKKGEIIIGNANDYEKAVFSMINFVRFFKDNAIKEQDHVLADLYEDIFYTLRFFFWVSISYRFGEKSLKFSSLDIRSLWQIVGINDNDIDSNILSANIVMLSGCENCSDFFVCKSPQKSILN